MDIYGRVMYTLGGGISDCLPMLIYSNHPSRDRFECEVRNMGLGLDVMCNVYKVSVPNARVEEKGLRITPTPSIIRPEIVSLRLLGLD